MSKEYTTRVLIVVITVIKTWIQNIVLLLLYKSHILLHVLDIKYYKRIKFQILEVVA